MTAGRALMEGVWRVWDSDVAYSFRRSPVAVAAAIVIAVLLSAALLAPWIAPHNPFDLRQLDLSDAFTPPAFVVGGGARYVLGTDNLGRDILSAILYGSGISLLVGVLSIFLAMAIGVSVGLVSGYFGGVVDGIFMRIADVQLTFPSILTALLIDGILRSLLQDEQRSELAIPVLVLAIGLSQWVTFARTVRGSTMVERGKDYVLAARLIRAPSWFIMTRHILPNIAGPILVIATIELAVSILMEATLSFLGVGMPLTSPSLGTLIHIGNDYLFSGEWWILVFPGATLIILVLAANLLGDWLRDALNPKLR